MSVRRENLSFCGLNGGMGIDDDHAQSVQQPGKRGVLINLRNRCEWPVNGGMSIDDNHARSVSNNQGSGGGPINLRNHA